MNAYIYNTSDSSVTIKADGQGIGTKTNPIYFTTNGLVSFFTKETSINVIVVDTPTITRTMKWSSMPVTKHRIVFPKAWTTIVVDEAITVSGTIAASDVTATYGVGAATGVFSSTLAAATLNTGQGANELYAMSQDVESTDAVTFRNVAATWGVTGATFTFTGAGNAATINTGQGANEVYAMNQDVETTDDVTHRNVTATFGVTAATLTVVTSLDFPAGSVAGADLVSDSVTDTQLAYNTGQDLTTASDPTFRDATVTYGIDVGTVEASGVIDTASTIEAGSGNITIVNATGNLDGEVIADNTIDTDSVDWGAGTGQIGFHSLATIAVVFDSSTITTTDMGKIYISTKTLPASFTLPYSSNTIDNGCVMIKNTGGSNIYSVIPSGTDQIDLAGASVAYDGIDADNDFVVLYNDAGAAGVAGNWYILGKNGSQ
ncbi:hypothetical protein FP828_03570 [bacterium]|nr:hypothetical protein [bacterium]